MPGPHDEVVIVGAGAAGLATADALRALGHRAPITLLGDEIHDPYDRPPLSKQVLAGTWDVHRTTLRSRTDLAAADIVYRPGARAARVDTAARRVILADGSALAYDALVAATGVTARRLPFGHDLHGVHVLRGIEDVMALRADLGTTGRLVVIGAGFLGSEVAATCRELGAAVALVDPLAHPLRNVLGDRVSAMIADLHRCRGVELYPGRTVSAIHAAGTRVGTVLLDDGTELDADAVVVAIGCFPAVEWLMGSGVPVAGPQPEDGGGGILCGATGRAVEGVWAAGDVAAWWSPALGRYVRTEHRFTANQHAQLVARDILGVAQPGEPQVPYFWSDQYDLKIQSYGLPSVADEVQIVDGDLAARRFVAVYTRDGQVTAVVGAGMPKIVRQWRQAVAGRQKLDPATAV